MLPPRRCQRYAIHDAAATRYRQQRGILLRLLLTLMPCADAIRLLR